MLKLALAPRRTGTTLLVLLMAALTTMASADLAQAALPLSIRAKLKCQTAIRKVSRTFVRKKLSILDKCATKVLKCIQTVPDGDKQQECVAKAGEKCAKPDGGAFAKIASEEERMIFTIRKACAVNGLTLDDMRGPDGLGFENLEKECGSLASVEEIAECIAGQHGCEAERMFAVQEPRAHELIAEAVEAAGLTAPPLACLEDLGDGENLDDPKGDGKLVVQCESTIQKAARTFIEEKLKVLGSCVDRAFLCVQVKEGADREICITAQAARFCRSEFARVRTAEDAVSPAVDKKCALDPGFYGVALSVPNGANLAGPTTACGDVGADPATYDGYKACLVAQHEQRVDQLQRFAMPRTDELLALCGCDLDTLTCGLPTPTITPTPTVTPTPP
jgi:hypothetical protein